MPRLYLLFHVPQQFLFDCVLRAAHGATGGGEATPSCPPSPRAPSPPPRLSVQRPTRKAEPAPAALPARRRRRSHYPVLGSAAIFRVPHRRQAAGPAPSHSRGRGVRSATGRREGRGAGGGCAQLGVAGPWARASRAAVMATRRLPPRGCEPSL